MSEKNTHSILETIKKKLQKFDEKSQKNSKISDVSDEFEYIATTSQDKDSKPKEVSLDFLEEPNSEQKTEEKVEQKIEVKNEQNLEEETAEIPQNSSPEFKDDLGFEDIAKPVEQHVEFKAEALSKQPEPKLEDIDFSDLDLNSPASSQVAKVEQPAAAEVASQENSAPVSEPDLLENSESVEETELADDEDETAEAYGDSEVSVSEEEWLEVDASAQETEETEAAAEENLSQPELEPEALVQEAENPAPIAFDDDHDLNLDDLSHDDLEEEKPAAAQASQVAPNELEVDDLDFAELEKAPQETAKKDEAKSVEDLDIEDLERQIEEEQKNKNSAAAPLAKPAEEKDEIDLEFEKELMGLKATPLETSQKSEPKIEAIPLAQAPKEVQGKVEKAEEKTAPVEVQKEIQKVEAPKDLADETPSFEALFGTSAVQHSAPEKVTSSQETQALMAPDLELDRLEKESVAKTSGILNDATIRNSADSIKKLIDAKNVVAGISTFSQSPALSELALQIMEPRLEKWLNDNLPEMVEQIVREEIKKIIPQA